MKTLLSAIMFAAAVSLLAGYVLPGRYSVHATGPLESSLKPSAPLTGALGRIIPSAWGTVALAYDGNGETRLRGTLAGGTCAHWSTDVNMHQNPDVITFQISSDDAGKPTLCFENVSSDTPVGAGVRATGAEIYIIEVNGEVIFMGPLAHGMTPSVSDAGGSGRNPSV